MRSKTVNMIRGEWDRVKAVAKSNERKKISEMLHMLESREACSQLIRISVIGRAQHESRASNGFRACAQGKLGRFEEDVKVYFLQEETVKRGIKIKRPSQGGGLYSQDVRM